MSTDLLRRRAPRWSDVAPYLARPGSRRPVGVARAATVADVRELARRRVPAPVFDFVDGAAEDEVTAARSRAAFGRVEFRPRALTGVAESDASVPLLGRRSALPVVLAPTGFTRLSHREGEVAVARAAHRAGVPMTLSTFGTVSIEDLAALAPGADLWFQLYVLRDRGLTASLVDRAAACGYTTLIVTIDSVVSGRRLRDLRHRLSIPPSLTPRTAARFATRPRWVYDALTSAPLELASLRDASRGDLWHLLRELADPTLTFAELAQIRERWPGPLVLKGVLTAEDARRARDAGADAIVLSNHGGRQLDRTPVGLELLAEVLDAVDDRVEVLVDGGVRSGADVVAALGLGARACLVGRAALFGLMAGGESGVAHVLDLLAADVDRTLRLLGVAAATDVTPGSGLVHLRGSA